MNIKYLILLQILFLPVSNAFANLLISPSTLNPGSMGFLSGFHLPEFAVNGSGMTPAGPLSDDSLVLATTQDTGNTWLASSGNPTGTIFLNFSGAQVLSSFYLWNYHDPDNGPHHHTGIGVNEFELAFYSGQDGTGSLLSSTARLFANAAIPTQNVQAQAFDFTTETGVQSVAMNIFSNHGSNFSPGFHEVGFSASPSTKVPAPAPIYLFALVIALTGFTGAKNRN